MMIIYGCENGTAAKKSVVINTVKVIPNSPVNPMFHGAACCKGTPTRSKFLVAKKH